MNFFFFLWMVVNWSNKPWCSDLIIAYIPSHFFLFLLFCIFSLMQRWAPKSWHCFSYVIYWTKGKHQLAPVTSCKWFWGQYQGMAVIIVDSSVGSGGASGHLTHQHLGLCWLTFHCNVLQTPMRFETFLIKTKHKKTSSCNFELG